MQDWLQQFKTWGKTGLPELATVLLGAAAIFLTKSLPSSAFSDFDPGVLAVSAVCCAAGMSLRIFSRT